MSCRESSSLTYVSMSADQDDVLHSSHVKLAESKSHGLVIHAAIDIHDVPCRLTLGDDVSSNIGS